MVADKTGAHLKKKNTFKTQNYEFLKIRENLFFFPLEYSQNGIGLDLLEETLERTPRVRPFMITEIFDVGLIASGDTQNPAFVPAYRSLVRRLEGLPLQFRKILDDLDVYGSYLIKAAQPTSTELNFQQWYRLGGKASLPKTSKKEMIFIGTLEQVEELKKTDSAAFYDYISNFFGLK